MTIRIGHLTDIHLTNWSDLRARHLLTKRLTGFANQRFRRRGQHQRHIVELAVARLIEEAPDRVIVSGDLTNVGMAAELQTAREVLAPLAEADIAVSVIPGNHDYYVAERTPGGFEKILDEFQAADARADDAAYPFVVRDGHVSTLMMKSVLPTLPFMAWGRVEEDELERADALLAQERRLGQTLCVAVHHHPRRSRGRKAEWSRNLRNATALRALVARHRVTLVLHGHNHTHQLTRMDGGEGAVICGLASSSVGASKSPLKRGEIGLYEFDESGLSALHFARWDANKGGFSGWDAVPLQEVMIEPPEDIP